MSAVKVSKKINYIRGEGIIMNERRKTKRTEFSSHLVIKRLNGEGVDEVAIEIIDISKKIGAKLSSLPANRAVFMFKNC